MVKNVTQREFKSTLVLIGVVLAVVLFCGVYLASVGQNFATNQVHSQLTQEKIYFPKAGTAALDTKEFPGLQKYAGQQVDNGAKAKAYADEFIWVHMMKASGNKTYAEISTAAQANPKDAKLAALKSTLFQGDMLRSSLLTAYAFSVFGQVAYWAKLALAIGGALILALVLWGAFGLRRS